VKKPIAILVVAVFVSLPVLQAQETIRIDAHAATTPFPHFWEQMFGSGHAILASA
jgi:xylan 1,4-beta-xylosidase